jgi:hypothetical protein
MSLDLKTLVIIRDAARALIDHEAGHARDSFARKHELTPISPRWN